jgi:hypothetical protein
MAVESGLGVAMSTIEKATADGEEGPEEVLSLLCASPLAGHHMWVSSPRVAHHLCHEGDELGSVRSYHGDGGATRGSWA